jgi:hypothetical protein
VLVLVTMPLSLCVTVKVIPRTRRKQLVFSEETEDRSD